MRRNIAPIALGLAALAVRLVAFLVSFDIPGDGPTHAILAYTWSRAPRFQLHGIWLPGFTYLAGAFAWLVPDPLVSARILNLLLGALTVPLFYLLVRRMYGARAALFSASVLVVLPLHVGLSTSSLTQATFLFLVVAAMLLFIEASAGPQARPAVLALAVLVFVLAQMTRYEAWVLSLAFPLYYLAARRRLLPTVCIAAVLSVFPLAWTLGNYLHTGKALLGISAAMAGTESGPAPLALADAIYALATQVAIQISWFLPILAFVGLLLQLAYWRRRPIRAETFFHTAVFGLYSLAMLAFTMARGNTIWDAYLLFGLVMALPYAALPLRRLTKPRGRTLAAAGVVILSIVLAPTVLLAPRIGPPDIYLTRQRPTEFEQLASWLRNSPYRNNAILLTRMDWKSTYLYLYAPEVHPRSFLYSFLRTDAQLGEFIRRQHPALLITSAGDETYQRHVEPFLAQPIRNSAMVYMSDTIQVYDIGRADNAKATTSANGPERASPAPSSPPR